MKLNLARRESNGEGTARNLFERYPFIGAVQIPLGQDRGFIRAYGDGDVDFHLEHIPDDQIHPGEEDSIRFTALDAPIFRFVLEVLESAREIVDEQAEALRNARADESMDKKPQIITGPAATPELNNFALK